MFVKFPSIPGLHKISEICKIYQPGEFEITEKIDGANFSILIENGEVKFARRRGVLAPDEKFYNYQQVISELTDLIEYLKTLGDDVQLYGELYGKGIQNRIYYGEKQYFRWFMLRIGKFVPLKEADKILADFLDLKVPVIETFAFNGSCQEFVDLLFEKIRSLDLEGKEGVVIKSREYPLCMIKYHTDLFSWKEPSRFNTDLINEERTKDLFAKYGEIKKFSQLEDYANYYLDDIKQDIDLTPKQEEKLRRAIMQELINRLEGKKCGT